MKNIEYLDKVHRRIVLLIARATARLILKHRGRLKERLMNILVLVVSFKLLQLSIKTSFVLV